MHSIESSSLLEDVGLHTCRRERKRETVVGIVEYEGGENDGGGGNGEEVDDGNSLGGNSDLLSDSLSLSLEQRKAGQVVGCWGPCRKKYTCRLMWSEPAFVSPKNQFVYVCRHLLTIEIDFSVRLASFVSRVLCICHRWRLRLGLVDDGYEEEIDSFRLNLDIYIHRVHRQRRRPKMDR